MPTPFFASLLRPSVLSTESTGWVCSACRRQQSSYRRTRKALRVKPDPAFLPSKTETQDHIIFNPPSSAPSVYHTPIKFLPSSDPRRQLHSLALKPTAAATPPHAEQPAKPPPASALQSIAASRTLPRTSQHLHPVRPVYEKKYNVTEAQVEEIRRLRKQDPKKWTRVSLAAKFGCSQFFVSLCCTSPEMAKKEQQKLDEVKSRWGRQKTEAREDRQTRKDLWGQDN